MKSKHCPMRKSCPRAGKCRACEHGRQYEAMAAKIQSLQRANRYLKRENSYYVDMAFDATIAGLKAVIENGAPSQKHRAADPLGGKQE